MYPDAWGSVVGYTVWTGALESAKVGVTPFESGAERVLLDGTSPRLTASGHLVFARDDVLWAVGFNRESASNSGTRPRRAIRREWGSTPAIRSELAARRSTLPCRSWLVAGPLRG